MIEGWVWLERAFMISAMLDVIDGWQADFRLQKKAPGGKVDGCDISAVFDCGVRYLKKDRCKTSSVYLGQVHDSWPLREKASGILLYSLCV